MSFKNNNNPIAAKTNEIILNYNDQNIDQIIEKILNNRQKNKNMFINFEKRKDCSKNQQNKEEYYKELHEKIKNSIRNKNNLNKRENPCYFLHNNNGYHYYFFFSDSKPNHNQSVMSFISKENIEIKKILQGLMDLELKNFIVNQIQDYNSVQNNNEIFHRIYNSDILIGCSISDKPKKGKYYMDALSPKLYVSNNFNLFLKLHRQAYKLEEQGKHCLEGYAFYIKNSGQKLGNLKQLNANKSKSALPFIRFGNKYDQSTNYYQNIIYDELFKHFNNIGLDIEKNHFSADLFNSDFVEFDKDYPELNIVNLSQNSDTFIQQNLDEHFKNKNYKLINQNQFEQIKNKKNKAFIFINDENSLEVKNKQPLKYNIENFKDVLFYHINEADPLELDFYTKLKLDHFNSIKNSTDDGMVIQGLEISDEKTLDKNVFNKIEKELSLKHILFQKKQKEITGLQNFNGFNGTAIYVIKKNQNKNQDNLIASVLNFKIENNSIYIQSIRIIKDQGKFLLEFEDMLELQNSTIFNESFYLIDNDTEDFVTSYSNHFIPNIIGNANLDNVKMFENKGFLSRKVKPNENPLPYYISSSQRRQRYYTFIENEEDNCLYFVSDNNSMQEKVPKQNLVYRLMLYQNKNKVTDPEKIKNSIIVQLFFSSFTFDIIQNNNSSKSSIFKKMARLLLEN